MDDAYEGFLSQINKQFDNLDVIEESARQIFNLYSAYVRVGFSEEQALIIVVQMITASINAQQKK